MKRNFYIFLFSLVLLVPAENTFSQDIHFSQFYASPLNLNPALTGFSEGSYRVSGIYRNQWFSVTTPFVTYSASYDMRLLEDKLGDDLFGVGGLVVADKSGDGELGMMGIYGSASYHKQLGSGKKHSLGLGIQGGYVQKTLNHTQLRFPNQFVDNDFDLTQSNGENFSGDNLNYIDLQTGLLWQSQFMKKLGAFGGLAVYHLTQPKESFLGDDSRLGMRYLLHGGARAKLTENIYLTPNFIFMYQDKAKEINLGTAVEYHFGLNNENTLELLKITFRKSKLKQSV